MAPQITPKSSNVQLFRLMIYNRPLHPELFELQQRSAFRYGDYEVENWLVPAGHVVRFQVGDQMLTETVIEAGDHLPETGLMHALPCLGEKDYSMMPTEEASRIAYVTTVQTESLTDNLYNATYREMVDFAEEAHALSCEFRDADGVPCLSVLDLQRYRREYHIQAYHLLGGSGTVLRTQSIFEVKG